ncbi:MAG: DUF4345 domain-containing protein [Bacteroidota bacterium]
MALRIIPFLAGLAIIYTGINVGFGGIITLGWQGVNDFAEATNQQRFLAQDSHVRFLGGVWLAVGALFVLSAIRLERFHSALRFAIIATFVGGLARFSQMNPGVTLGPDIVGSLAAELIGMPVLYFWLAKVVNIKTNSSPDPFS